MSDPDAQRRDCLELWDGAADGWRRAQPWMRDYAAGVSHWLIDAIEPQPGQTILELAAGPGETGLLAAELVSPGGKLISTDQSEAMVEIARARAAELGVTNVEHKVMNAESIDLDVASVDAVLCRWGLMLMVDPAAALVESRRVLRPGGHLALAVWAEPDANPWLVLPNRVFVEHGLLDAPEPGTPGAFALSEPVKLEALLEEAGFAEIELDTIDLVRRAPSFEAWWEMHLDMSPAGRAVREVHDPSIAAEVKHALAPYGGGEIAVPGRCLMARASA
ncbi:MAG: methyltransferase domain-containing protein [Solirubrobacteraceae bacterium]